MHKSAPLGALLLMLAAGSAGAAFNDPRPAFVYADFGNAVQSYKDEDYAEAFKEFRLLAERGDAVGQYYLGVLYHRGEGVVKDDAQAAAWFRKAAEQGHALAQNELGTMYFRGRGVAQDNAQAGVWYRKAAQKGLAAAQDNLSDWLNLQQGDHRNEAIVWLRKAARQGDPAYQLKLGEFYGRSGSGQEQPLKSAYWMRKAAEQGLGSAESYMGTYYLYGIGVRKDYARAAEWFRRAYPHGSSAAAEGLGSMYDNGLGVAKDQALAIEWYCKAAEMGYGQADNAIYRLGALGTAGRPCLLKVAAAGSAVAQHQIADEYAYDRDIANAVIWYRKAAEQGEEFSLWKLAEFYEAGNGVPRDPVVAMTLLELSRVSGQSSSALWNHLDHALTAEQHAEAGALAAAWKPGTPLPEKSRTGTVSQQELAR